MFYATYAKERLQKNIDLPHSLGRDNNPPRQRERAGAIRDLLVKLGLSPDHNVLDYGCGSLWVGEALMEYLEPGRYTGVDVIEDFYMDAVKRIPQALIQRKRPKLRLIDAQFLSEEKETRLFDFILSIDVLLHVPPDAVDDYFRNITSMAAEGTRILIAARIARKTASRGTIWAHGHDALAASLAKLGYEIAAFGISAEYRRSTIHFFEVRPATGPKSLAPT